MTTGDAIVGAAAIGAACVLIVTGHGIWVVGVILAAMFLIG
jgi:hypothetical protein